MSKKLPHYNEKTTRWVGGDSRTLYLFTDKRNHNEFVCSGDRNSLRTLGPALDVRVATRAEAEEHWQNPLHSGWKTAETVTPSVSSRRVPSRHKDEKLRDMDVPSVFGYELDRETLTPIRRMLPALKK